MSTLVRSLWSFLLFFLTSFSFVLSAQTILRPGDLAVVGVNANLLGCGQGNLDLISFVVFQDITTGTTIDITDNGWERANPGQWGNTEGFITVTRTGGTIPAGTIITFRLPAVGQATYTALAPDNGWTFTSLGSNTLNFNSSGDQVYFLQGGEWDNGTTGQHNATYIGGTILFGFNTKSQWIAGSNDPQDSGLHPDVQPCFHMEPSSGATDFLAYTGPLTQAGQLEWIRRLSDAANWTSFPNCPAYQAPAGALNLQLNDVQLACTVCSGCDTLLETLNLSLPLAGGPFTVVYTDGTRNYTAANKNNGDTAQVVVTKTVGLSIVSVTDANGCPIFSNFGPADTVVVNSPPIPGKGARLTGCDDGSGQGLFDLTRSVDSVSLSPGEPVNWFLDAQGTQPISDPAAFRSASDTVYAFVGDSSCAVGPVPVVLTIQAGFQVDAVVEKVVSCQNFSDGAVRITVNGGTAPYRYDWSDDRYDNQDNPTNVRAGSYTITITDLLGCQDSTTISLSQPDQLNLSCGQQRPVSAVGASDGQAIIDVGGGVAPYTLRWTGPRGGAQGVNTAGRVVLDSLAAGSYQLVLTDTAGCEQNCVFTISDPACSISLSLTVQQPTCAGLNDGTIELVISGGTAPYRVDWGDEQLKGQNLSKLPPGAYLVVVTDTVGCTAQSSVSLRADFPALSADISSGGPVCPGECFGFLLTLQGTPPFTLQYELVVNGAPVIQTLTTSNFNDQLEICPANLGSPRDSIEVRFLAIQDANCTRPLDRSGRIIRLLNPVDTVDQVLCFGDSLVVNGMVYNAANPQGTEIITGGSVTGCDSTVVINLQFHPSSEQIIDSELCEGESVIVNNRVYDEGNPSGVEILKGAGANGCDSLVRINLRFLQDTLIRLEPVLCAGQSLTVNGQVYNSSRPAGTEILQRSTGCDSTVQINLRFIDEVVFNLDTLLCGNAELTVNGRTYNRTNPSGREVITGGAAGGCDSVIVVNLIYAGGETRIDSTLCEGDSLVVNGRVYNRNNPGGQEILPGSGGCDSVIVVNLTFESAVTTNIDSTLCSGQSLTVNGVLYNEQNPTGSQVLQRRSGCDSTVVVNLQFVPAVTAALEGGGQICRGDSAALVFRLSGAPRADVQFTDGVNPPVLVRNLSDGQTIRVTPTATTTYRIEFVLAAGAICPAQLGAAATVEVSDLNLRLEASDFNGYGVSCAGSANGVIRAISSGGQGPLRYAWSTGATDPIINNVPAGSYSVTVTDNGGCALSDSLTLIAPDSLIIQSRLINPTCPGDRDGAIVIDAIDGGAGPYRFAVGENAFSSASTLPVFIRDLSSGEFLLRVDDSNGCGAQENFSLRPVTDLRLDLGQDTTLRRGDSLQFRPVINFSADSVIWSPATGLSDPKSLNPTVRPTASGVYTLTLFDPKGCRISDRISIGVENRSRVYAGNAFSPNNDGVNDQFVLFARPDDVKSYTLRIFDRWGGLVFEREEMPANNDSEGWNGNVRGKPGSPGVYVFYAEIIYRDGTEERLSGEVVLLR